MEEEGKWTKNWEPIRVEKERKRLNFVLVFLVDAQGGQNEGNRSETILGRNGEKTVAKKKMDVSRSKSN